MKKIHTIITLILTLFILSSCAFMHRDPTNKKLIVTTLYPEYDMIKHLISSDAAKNLYDVVMIVKPGQDLHTYDPSLNDLIIIKNADIFIYTSDELETWVKDVDFSEKTKIINLSKDERIKHLYVEDHNEDHDHEQSHEHSHRHTHAHSYDPHYWVDPIYSSYMLDTIKNAIISDVREKMEEGYEENCIEAINKEATKYTNEILKIDANLKKLVSVANNRTLYFGSPFSFFYLTSRYGLSYELTYSTCSTETEPSVEVLTHIINEMKENDINVIFSKELINTQACEMIAMHTGAKVLELHSGHNVSANDFNNSEVTYISLMRKNTINIAKMLKVDDSYIQILEEGGNL